MPKSSIYYVCSECGTDFQKWQGQCSSCHAWNTLKEFSLQTRGQKSINLAVTTDIIKLQANDSFNPKRLTTRIDELDRVLGGGIVEGSVMLVAGKPGIGKSTLLLSIATSVENTLYVSGEESAGQVGIRLKRLGSKKHVNFIASTDIDQVIASIVKFKPSLVIVDSIQTMYDSNYPSTPGSIVQIRETALKLQGLAKQSNIACILVGHVTKDGNIAGPKLLEHMVDVVVYLEGDRRHNIRLLRSTKNRFGATDEVGVFKMTESGMEPVDNPSQLFLAERLSAPGSVVTTTLEGSRPMLVEVQALTCKSNFISPKRVANGYSKKRLDLIIAVLIQRVGLKIGMYDIFINIVGGFSLSEPAVDAAIALAIVSSYRGLSISKELAIIGEVGLSGELRTVPDRDQRAKEAKRMGYALCDEFKTISQLIAKYCPNLK